MIKFSMDPEDGEVFMSMYLNNYRPWYERTWIAVKYVFGAQSRFGAFDCTILRHEDYHELHDLLDRSMLVIKTLELNREVIASSREIV